MPTRSGVDHKPVRLCNEIRTWIERAADNGSLGNDDSSIIESRESMGKRSVQKGMGGGKGKDQSEVVQHLKDGVQPGNVAIRLANSCMLSCTFDTSCTSSRTSPNSSWSASG